METQGRRPGNRLLAALPEQDYARLSPYLTEQTLTRGHVLQRHDQPIRLVYFPDQSLCWLVNPTEDGSTAQVAMVGPEGLVGIEAVLGSRVAMSDAIVHAACENVGRTMSVDAFKREFERRGAFYSVTQRYAGTLMRLLSRSAMCNAWHSAEERCCRWLLEAQARVGRPELCVTHEVLSDLLGLRRSTVTLILGRLSENGIVSTNRGLVRVDDRAALEQRSCGCHQLVTAIMGDGPSRDSQLALR